MNIVEEIEQKAVVAWDEFLGGVKWLSTEASALAAWAEGKDPAIAKTVQDLITKGETAAEALAAKGGTTLSNLISAGIDQGEQDAADLIQKAAGNTPGGVVASSLATAGLADLGDIVSNMATVGYTRALAAIAGAAGVQAQPAGNAAAASTTQAD